MTEAARDPTRKIGGFPVLATRAEDLIALLADRRVEGLATELMFANTNFVLTCHPMADALGTRRTIVVNDGIGLDIASLMFHRRLFPENLNGTDFVPRLLASVDATTRVFLLGARVTAVTRAAAVWSELPNVEIVGILDGYEGMADDRAVIATIVRARPDVLLVALGDPRQAAWIVAHRETHRVPLVVGVGALFDFVSRTMPRAPRWIRRMRLEWLYRLSREPRRLLKRYTIDLVAFFVHCASTHRSALRRSGVA